MQTDMSTSEVGMAGNVMYLNSDHTLSHFCISCSTDYGAIRYCIKTDIYMGRLLESYMAIDALQGAVRGGFQQNQLSDIHSLPSSIKTHCNPFKLLL